MLLDASIDEGWHIYSIRPAGLVPLPGDVSRSGPTSTFVAASPPYAVLDVVEPEPESSFDPGFDLPVLVHHGDITISLLTDAPAVTVTYQACNGSTCLPPRQVVLNTKAN